MKPITEKEVPKVVQAIRQAPSRKVLSKLLTRIKVRCLAVVFFLLTSSFGDYLRSPRIKLPYDK